MTAEEHIEKTLEEGVNQRIEQLSKELAKPLSARREPTQVLDYDKLMDIGARLLKQKTDEHLSATSSYEVQRAELFDSYRVRMERLKMEAEEQLRSLDQLHAEKMSALEKLINKLKTLREG